MNEMSMVTRALLVFALVWLGDAQETNRFEVVDVHSSLKTKGIRMPFINSEMRGGYVRGGRYELHNATMADLIGVAWGLDTDKVIGGPAWLDRDQFEIIAKAPAGATP